MVAPATRSQVLAAVEAVGFVPNRSARQLVSGRAGAIGVIVPDITNPYFGAILRAIQARARHGEHGDHGDHGEVGVLIADTGGDADEERRAIATLGRQVDGLVVITPLTDLASAPVPVVQVDRQSRRAPSVVVDQAAIVDLAVEHLAALGHRQIAVVRGPAAYWSAGRRDQAVERLRRDHCGDDLAIQAVGPTPGTFAAGRAAFAAARATGATGFIAFNDLQAAGLLLAAHDAGLDVPGALSIVGSDGLELAAMTSPPLTTVAAPLDELGRVAYQRLGDLLAADASPSRTTLDPHLVVGASTAAPPTELRKDL